MPRNGSGTYAAPSSSFNPAVAETTIDQDDWNTLLADLETALSNSIDRTGETTTTDVIPFAAGVSTDTIAERSANAGVTVDGVLLKDGGATFAGNLVFEGATADDYETTFAITDPTADRTITFPDITGTVMLNLVEDTTPQLGAALDTNGKSVHFSQGADVASASQPNIWAGDGNFVHISGTTGISDFTDAPRIGASAWLYFEGACALTSGSGITIAGGSVTTAAGDIARVVANDAVDAFVLHLFRANGFPVITPQISAASTTSTNNITTTSYADLADLSVTITPRSSASRFKISVGGLFVQAAASASSTGVDIAITDGSNNVISGVTEVGRGLSTSGMTQSSAINAYHAPASASAQTYKVRAKQTSGGTGTWLVGGNNSIPAFIIVEEYL